jgi:sulfane dehydrogenase subunit SoxC
MAYGERSRFVTTTRTTMTMIGNMDMHRGVANWDARAPLAEMIGTITPSSLHFISAHGNTAPDINPKEHRLIIHGLVERPLVFTLEELMRLPYVTRIHYIECINNRPSRGRNTVDEGHGMISCSEWTGVPLSLLLKEAGVKRGGDWVVAEGAEETKHASSMAMGKAMDDVIVAYGQNGEPVRPHQGYPLRLVVPGFEGKYNLKWLKGIKVVDRPYMSYWEQHHYMDSHKKTRGPVQDRRAAAGDVRGHVHVGWLQYRQARRRRVVDRVHRCGQCRPARRIARGDDYRDGRQPGGGYAERANAACALP